MLCPRSCCRQFLATTLRISWLGGGRCHGRRLAHRPTCRYFASCVVAVGPAPAPAAVLTCSILQPGNCMRCSKLLRMHATGNCCASLQLSLARGAWDVAGAGARGRGEARGTGGRRALIAGSAGHHLLRGHHSIHRPAQATQPAFRVTGEPQGASFCQMVAAQTLASATLQPWAADKLSSWSYLRPAA